MRYLVPPPASGPKGKRVAVVGSGISGLSAAWLLSKRHHVTLYERDSRIGGHSHTVDVDTGHGTVPVDTGFIVYNERNYPNLTAMLKHLGVATEASTMSFAASLDEGGFEYSSASLNRFFGQRRNLARPRFWRMTSDLLRFYRTARELVARQSIPDVSLGEYLQVEGYSATFAEDHILPMSAAIWSTTPAEIRAYPLAAFTHFYSSHALFNLRTRPEWRTVSGGSREYVSRLAAAVTDIRSGVAIRRIERGPGSVMIEEESGRSERFSDVVLATHADQALSLLKDADPLEREILGAFRYTNNDAVLHRDDLLMPRNRRVWSSWNFIGAPSGGDTQQMSVTYWMNSLQNIDRRTPLFVTLNPCREPAAGSVLGRYSYSHPYFDRAALAAQDQLWRLQARRGTWFCGAYFGYGFHEDGLQSGLAVAEALGGVRRPWDRPADRIAQAVPTKQDLEVAA